MATCKSTTIFITYMYLEVFSSEAFLEDFIVISLPLKNFSNLQP